MMWIYWQSIVVEEKHLWFFSKSGYTKSVIEQARKDHATLLTIDDLFD